MAYTIKYLRQAIEDAKKLKNEEPKAFQKLLKLENELKEHPHTGTGKLLIWKTRLEIVPPI